MRNIYLSNAFSIQMIRLNKETSVKFKEISLNEVKEFLKENKFVSAIGHQDTANILTEILGIPVKQNRVSINLNKDDVLYVAQLTGGRLPEGTTSLPEGFEFKFIKVYLSDSI